LNVNISKTTKSQRNIAVGEQSSLGGARCIYLNVQTKILPNVLKFFPFFLLGLGWSQKKEPSPKSSAQIISHLSV